jgi:PAS domain S-box-containing protein
MRNLYLRPDLWEVIRRQGKGMQGPPGNSPHNGEVLHESGDGFRTIFQNQQTGLLLIDPANRTILDANQSALRMIGAEPGDVIGKGCHTFVCPDKTGNSPVIDHGDRVGLSERVLVRKNGETLSILTSVHPVVVNNRSCLLVSLIDITELKQVEEELRMSNERFQRLLSQSFDAIIVHQDGRILIANDSAVRMHGGTQAGDFIGRSLVEFVHPEYRGIVAERMKEVAKAPDITLPPLREKFLRLDGSAIDVEVMATMTQHGGRPATMVVFRDITRQIQAQEELFQSRQMLRLVLDSIPQRVFWKDRNSVFLGCNKPLANDVGYDDPADMIGKTDYDHSSAAIAEKFREDDLEVIETGIPKINFEEPQIRSDGSTSWLRTSKVPLRNREGEIIGVLGTYEDITENKKVEDALMMANRKLNLLSGITRHDIKNQLQALQAYITLSEESIGNPELLREFLEKEKMIAETINEQISFTKDYEDLGVTSPAWQDAGMVADSVASSFHLHGLQYSIDLPPIEIFADPMLEKVFYNLIDNSLHYGGPKMTSIRITGQQEGKDFHIIYEDDGEGISHEDKSRLFTKGFGRHTGLGMFLSREILFITGITITEEGEPGKGARFVISVPREVFRYAGSRNPSP